MKPLEIVKRAFLTETGFRGTTVCLALALLLTLLLFGNVIFLGASLAPLDYDFMLLGSVNPPPPASSVIPERDGRRALDGQGDFWSGSSQFQPAQRFMAFCLRSGESPYWDPYSATGIPGPEVLADLKFAPVTLATALLGGSSTALTFVLLGLYFGAVYCVLRTFTDCLRLSFGAAFAAAAVYSLNGFALTNLNLAVGQPYLVAPIVLYAMLRLLRRQSPLNALFAVAANVALFSTTFTPTLTMTVLVVYSLTLAFELAKPRREWVRSLVIHIATPSVAVLLLAFLYVPVVDAFTSYMRDIAGFYRSRPSPGISLLNLLSLFTPKHFWEPYVATPPGPFEKITLQLGIIGSLIATHAFRSLKRTAAFGIAAATVCLSISLGQIYGIFPFTLLDSVSFFSFIRNDYWACMASLAFVVLVAYGWEAISSKNALGKPAAVLVGVMVVLFLVLYNYLGLNGQTAISTWTERYLVIFWLILVFTATILVFARSPRFTVRAKHVLLIGLIVEGLYYMNGLRPGRSDRDVKPTESIAWLKSEVDRRPGSRMLNIGRTGVFPNWPSGLQIPSLDFLSYMPMSYYVFYQRYIGVDFVFATLGVTPNAKYLFSDASLSLTGVRYVMVDAANKEAISRLSGLGFHSVHSDIYREIFENPHAMARSFVVDDVRTFDGLPSDVGASVDRSAATTDVVLLQELRALGVRVDQPVQASAGQADLPGTVQVTAYHHDRVLLKCKLERPAMVVLTDSWNPRWRVMVDRKPAYIGKVDFAFRGVAVAAGEHEIEFRYHPASRLVGQAISGIALVGLILGLWVWSKALRRRGQASGLVPAGAAVPATDLVPATGARSATRDLPSRRSK